MDNLDLFLSRRLSALADLTDGERENARAASEAENPFEGANLESLEAVQISDEEVAALISPEARNFVIGFEVGSRTLYNRKYDRPIWPGGGSGVTVGIGYDIGVQSRDVLHHTWDGLIPSSQIVRLARAVGVTGLSAKAMCPGLLDIIVPWDVAIDAYSRSTMPTFGRLVLGAFPNAAELHPHSFGALFSLVFNRGARLTERPGTPTRSHMRNIRDHLASRKFDKVASEFRAMKSIWAGQGLDGLLRRREAEAVLFEEGLQAQARLAAAPPVAAVQESAGGLNEAQLEAADPAYDGDALGWDVDTEESLAVTSLEAQEPWVDVSWPPYPDSPDYHHIGDSAATGKAFIFTPADLEFLLRANSFAPTSDTGLFVFGLRGARLIASVEDTSPTPRQVDRDQLVLQEVAPDHQHFRCVIGVYNPLTRRLSGFPASTLPCRRAVHVYKTNKSSGNLTPTGLYRFTVDWHLKSKPERAIPGCLHEGGRQKAIWRSTNDLRYDLTDTLENDHLHGNNVHPSLVERSAEFSSFGCLVVSGNFKVTGSNRANGTHLGEWARFRQALGLIRPGTSDHGKVIDMVVLTGLEAAIASAARAQGQTTPDPAMMRLRQGSSGPRVRLLETALGLPETGVFSHKVMKALGDKQRQLFGAQDGVYSPATEARLGIQVFSADLVAGAAPESLESAGFGGLIEEDLLLQEIGLRTRLTEIDPESVTEDAVMYESVMLESTFGDLKALGLRMFQRIERSFHGVLCGDNPEDAADRERFTAMLNDAALRGRDAVQEALQWLLTATLFVPPKLAAPIAGLIVKRVIEPAAGELVGVAMPVVEQTCRSWAIRLRGVESGSQAPAATAPAH